MCSTFMDVLLWSSGSSSNLLLVMVMEDSRGTDVKVMADSMGTDVKSAETSYEVAHSPGCNLIPLTCCTKSPVFLMWCGDFQISGLKILANSLATL